MIRLFPLLVALFCAVAASSATAQVLVYKIDFRKDKGINYHPFSGGYFVAPLLGGTGSFLLTSTDDERVYVESAEGGRLFTALSGGGKKAVISATTGAGTSMGAMVALGDINHVVQVNGPTFSLSARVAKSLTGTAVSADDESESEGPASDGSVGSAGVSEIKVNLDEEETNRANRKGLTLAQTLEQLKLELERQGFHNEDGDDDDDDTEEEAVVVEP
ncbi:MAG TPA: hypothetical protein VK956_09515 [Verrucomicrobium sp.]|nr:hypothetical protein [Verrucomicrobium sp.]